MLPLAIALTYVVVGALFVWFASRFVVPISMRSAVALLAAPLLFVGPAIFRGAVYAPLEITYATEPFRAHRDALGVPDVQDDILGDVVYQMIPWHAAFRDALANGRLPVWNPFVLNGEPLLAVQQHGGLHPSFWLGLFLPLAGAWTFGIALRLLLAVLGGYLFLRETRCGELPSLFGALAWAFCDSLLFHLGFNIQPATSALPLLMIGLGRIARDPNRPAAAITMVALLLLMTAGHPETALHVVAAAGIYFLFELYRHWSRGGWRSVSWALTIGCLALGICAVMLLPFREALHQTFEYQLRTLVYAESDRSVSLSAGLARLAKALVPYAFGAWGYGGEKGLVGPAGYVGAVVLPLSILGLLTRRAERWPLLVIGILGACAWSRIPVVTDLLSRLPLFRIAVNERMGFLAAFAAAALGAFGLERLVVERRYRQLLGSVAVVAAGIVYVFNRAQPHMLSIPPGARNMLLAYQLVPLAILGATGLLLYRHERNRLLMPSLVLLLVLAQRRLEFGSLYEGVPARALAPKLPLLDRIPRGAPVRIAAVGRVFVPNVSALYGLEDVRGYEAMHLAAFADLFPLWCVPQGIWFNRVDDPTTPFLSFLNVRYVILPSQATPPRGWPVLYRGDDGILVENPKVLPRVFVPKSVFRTSDVAAIRHRLERIPDFLADGTIRGTPEGQFVNGSAHVSLENYRGDRLRLGVVASQRCIVGTSLTAWEGWRLEIDGSPAPLLSYNQAFVGFEVQPGRHDVLLSYRPRSMTRGLGISGLSIGLCLGLGVLLGRSKPASAP